MGVIPADSLALGARVAHVFVATSDKAAVLPRPASPVRTAAVPNRLSRPYVHRRRHQLFFQQPSPRSWPGLSSSRAIEGAPRGRWLSTWKIVLPPRPGVPSKSPSLEARGPRCLQLRAWRRSFSLFEGTALGRRRFAPPRRARSRATLPSL